MACSIAGTLDVIGDRWTMLLLRDLFIGLKRHDEFRNSTGIPPTTLSNRLKNMEVDGLISRSRYQHSPDRFEYHLTKKARELWPIMLAMTKWGDKHNIVSRNGPPMKIIHRETGNDANLMVVDSKTNEQVNPKDLIIVEGVGANKNVRDRLAVAARVR